MDYREMKEKQRKASVVGGEKKLVTIEGDDDGQWQWQLLVAAMEMLLRSGWANRSMEGE